MCEALGLMPNCLVQEKKKMRSRMIGVEGGEDGRIMGKGREERGFSIYEFMSFI